MPLPKGGDWAAVPAKYLFVRKQRPADTADEIITAFRDGVVTLRSNRRMEGFTNAVQEIGYQGIRKGDLVIHSMDGFAGAIGVSDSDGKASPVVHAYRPTTGTNSRFYAYVLRNMANFSFIAALAKGIRERSTAFDSETFRALLLPHPPLSLQIAIADYLDAETTRIDALIAKKRRMIDLLQERWGVTVRNVVLYEPDGELAPLGPLKRWWRIIDCKHRTPLYVDTGFPVVSPGDVSPGVLDLSRCHRFVNKGDYLDLTDGRLPMRGDMIYSRNASIGIAAYVDTDEKFTMGQDVCMITSDVHDQRFLTYVLNTVGLDQLQEAKVGSTFSRVNIGQIAELLVPMRSPSVQGKVADTLDREWQIVNRVGASLRQQITLLAQRRQALITAAVTNQVEVPGVAA